MKKIIKVVLVIIFVLVLINMQDKKTSTCSSEICDGIDNDCDGIADELVCYSGIPKQEQSIYIPFLLIISN